MVTTTQCAAGSFSSYEERATGRDGCYGLTVFVLKFYFVKHFFTPLNTFMGKGKDQEPVPDPYL